MNCLLVTLSSLMRDKRHWTIINNRIKKIIFLMLSCTMFSAFSTFNVYEFDDTEKARQFNELIAELRCPKCQNNNLADSNAPLATDIKNYIYQSIKAGKSQEEITDFLISRYGEFVTYRPRNRWVWILPPLIGCLAFLIAVINISKKRHKCMDGQKKIPDMTTIIRQHQEDKNGE